MSKLLIKGGTAVFADKCEVCDILVDGKKIVKIAKNVEEKGAKVIDAKGLHVFPLRTQPVSAALEAFFNGNPKADQACTGLVHNVHKATQRFSVCKEIIDDEHSVLWP